MTANYEIPKSEIEILEKLEEPIQRLKSLDRIRGFAIFGILILNIHAMASPYEAYFSPYWNQGEGSTLDVILYQFVFFFFDGRFMTMLAMLFGAGLMIQLNNKEKKPISRRLMWLMLIGLLHGVFLFNGDILLFYGICGFILIQTKFTSLTVAQLIKRSIIIGVVLSCLSLAYYYGLNYSVDAGEFSMEAHLNATAVLEKVYLWTGPYVDQIIPQAIEYSWGLLEPIAYLYIWFAMVLGGLLFKIGFYESGLNNKVAFLILLIATVFMSVPAYLMHSYEYGDKAVIESVSIFKNIGTILFAIFYSHLFIKLSNTNYVGVLLEKAGKIALTLYITQSIAMLLLFRVFMIDWYAMLSRFEVVLIALMFIALQLVFTHFYFKKFKQGPMEWVWRKLVQVSS